MIIRRPGEREIMETVMTSIDSVRAMHFIFQIDFTHFKRNLNL